MTELFDKQVNAQKESLKKTSAPTSLQLTQNFSSHKLPQAHRKCVMKMKQTRKKRQAPKIFLMEGRSL